MPHTSRRQIGSKSSLYANMIQSVAYPLALKNHLRKIVKSLTKRRRGVYIPRLRVRRTRVFMQLDQLRPRAGITGLLEECRGIGGHCDAADGICQLPEWTAGDRSDWRSSEIISVTWLMITTASPKPASTFSRLA